MPDLLTHSLLNLVLPMGALRRRELGVFVFGGVLPDLVSRVPTLFISRFIRPLLGRTAVDLDWLVNGFTALHLPIGLAAACGLLASGLPGFLWGGISRRRALALLVGGGAVHLLADVTQAHMRPAYRYLFPFSMRPLELGWFDADLGFMTWPVLLPLAWLAWRRSRP